MAPNTQHRGAARRPSKAPTLQALEAQTGGPSSPTDANGFAPDFRSDGTAQPFPTLPLAFPPNVSHTWFISHHFATNSPGADHR